MFLKDYKPLGIDEAEFKRLLCPASFEWKMKAAREKAVEYLYNPQKIAEDIVGKTTKYSIEIYGAATKFYYDLVEKATEYFDVKK